MTTVLVRFLASLVALGWFFVGRGGATAFLIQLEDDDPATDLATRSTRTGIHHNEQQPQRRQLRPRTIDPATGFNFTGGINTEQEPSHSNATRINDDDEGAPSLRKHIVNGYTVNQATNRYPYTVLLYRNDFDRFYCGGSLIAPDIVSYD